MNERQQAWKIANMWLDGRMSMFTQMIPGDPDCDACVLARQYMRALDKIAQLTEVAEFLNPSAAMVQAQMRDKWPKAIQP